MSNLPQIQLDPRNEYELWEQAADHAFNVSGGVLRNFSPGDPLSYLLEAQVYAGAELLWYLNRTPTALLLRWLQQFGLTIDEGSNATGSVIVNFTAPLPGSAVIPAGTLFSNGVSQYESLSSVIAPTGSESITVQIRAIDKGTEGNTQAFTVTNINTPIAFTRNCYNPDPISGGKDPLTPDEAIQEFTRVPQDQQIVSIADLKREVIRYLGERWVVRVISNYNPTLGSTELGSLAVLVDNPAIEQVPVSILNGLQNHLESVAPLNVSPWVSQLIRVPTRSVIEITVPDNTDPELVAENLYREILNGLGDMQVIDPERLHPMVFRSGGGLRSIRINGEPSLSVSLSKVITPDYLEIVTYNSIGSRVFIYGNGDPD